MINHQINPEDLVKPPWMKDIPAREKWRDSRWAFHKQFPDMDIYSYRHATRQMLGEEVAPKKLIYLDLKYWIFFRDVLMRQPQKPIHREIFLLLLKLVAKGKCLCPFSYPIFCELHKQGDLEKRRMMARAIDLLGDSVCLQNPDALTRSEILGFIRRHHPRYEAKLPRRVCVWTKASYCLSEPIPVNTAFSEADQLLIQKCMDDVFMTMTTEEFVDALGSGESSFPLPPPAHEKLNENKRRFAGEAKDFRTAYLNELAATIDFHGRAIHDVFVHIFHDENGYAPDEPYREDATPIQAFKSLFYNVFKQGKFPGELPCFHTESAIHAAMRVNKTRNYKANDEFDFQHAAMAMPYYDYFFTENSLANFVTHPPLSFDKLYGAKALSNEEAVLSVVRELG